MAWVLSQPSRDLVDSSGPGPYALLFSWRKTFRDGPIGTGNLLGFIPATVVRDPLVNAASVGSVG
jgi:hypothetical protein